MKIGLDADTLADKWIELQKKKYELSVEELVLINEIQDLAANETKTRGVINVQGDENVIKITRRENVKYDKDGDVDVLMRIAKEMDGIENMITLSVREKGTQITKIFEKPVSERSNFEQTVWQTLEEFRVVTEGKPSIKVEPRK